MFCFETNDLFREFLVFPKKLPEFLPESGGIPRGYLPCSTPWEINQD